MYIKLVIAIIVLNVFDVVNTLEIIQDISDEINPVMRHALVSGVGAFAATKFLLIVSGLYVLFKYKPILLWPVFFLYLSVVSYQFFIIFYLAGGALL
jgi:hypothetical protein